MKRRLWITTVMDPHTCGFFFSIIVSIVLTSLFPSSQLDFFPEMGMMVFNHYRHFFSQERCGCSRFDIELLGNHFDLYYLPLVLIMSLQPFNQSSWLQTERRRIEILMQTMQNGGCLWSSCLDWRGVETAIQGRECERVETAETISSSVWNTQNDR